MNWIPAINRGAKIVAGVLAMAFVSTACNRIPSSAETCTANYEMLLEKWNSPEQVSAWIGENFRYDRDRAAMLSNSRKENGARPEIYDASKLFEKKSGICVDLSRFCVDTLKDVCPQSDPKYVKIEFEPVEFKGNVFRFHWVTSFKRDGKIFIMADSKRPGKIVGPYESLEDFSVEYERFRSRKIIEVRELDSFRKTMKKKAKKRSKTRMSSSL